MSRPHAGISRAQSPSAAPARVPVASRLPVAADSSDDDEDVVDATPVKAPTRVQPMRAAKSPSKSPMADPRSLPKPRASPRRSPKALRALFPDAKALAGAADAAALPPRVAKKHVARAKPANAFGRLAGGFGGDRLETRGGGGGGFARLAEAKKQNAFEPLLCDARGVLDDGVLDIGDGAPAMTLSNLLAREPTRRRGGGGDASKPPEPSAAGLAGAAAAAAKPAAKDAETKPSPCSAGPAARKRGGARCDVDPDEDEMLAAMEAGEEDFDAAEARAAAGAARRREAAAARTRDRRNAEADASGALRRDTSRPSRRGDGSEDDEDYVESEDDDFAITTTNVRKRKRASAAETKLRRGEETEIEENRRGDRRRRRGDRPRPATGRERAEARNAAVAAAAEAKKRKPSGGRAKPAEAADWRAAGDEAPDRVPALRRNARLPRRPRETS